MTQINVDEDEVWAMQTAAKRVLEDMRDHREWATKPLAEDTDLHWAIADGLESVARILTELADRTIQAMTQQGEPT